MKLVIDYISPWLRRSPYHYATSKSVEFPVVTPSAEESEQLTLYNTDILKLYNETVTAWIIGGADIDAEWDDFVEKMNDFGAQEVLAIKQAQADRYFSALGD